MDGDAIRLAFVIGLLQGIFEWLPISSEGNISLYLAVVEGMPASAAVRYSLLVHVGTAAAATVYYRGTIGELLGSVPGWSPAAAFDEHAETSFLVAASLVSAGVGVVAYLLLEAVISTISGAAFVGVIGALLVITGVVQRVADGALGARIRPSMTDAVLVGSLQGLAILPGVSRSGTTISALLLRGYDATTAFRLSFLLSIPAALGAGGLAALDTGPTGVGPAAAAVALVTSAIIGYATIGGLLQIVRRIAFWAVCIALGTLAMMGGLVAVI